MKVVHVIKRIEMIDQDVKELKKLEKTVARNKSFSTPIYMSIEKQINLLLGERIKLLELRIENPPEALVEEIEGPKEEQFTPPAEEASKSSKPKKKAAPKGSVKKTQKKAAPKADPVPAEPKPSRSINADDIPMMTQDDIDARLNELRQEKTTSREEPQADDDSKKLLDLALERGSLGSPEKERNDRLEKEKKVRFFRENFPVE